MRLDHSAPLGHSVNLGHSHYVQVTSIYCNAINYIHSQFMVGFGYIFKIQKEVKFMHKQPSCIKKVRPSKSLGERSCEIKGGGHKIAAMMLMILTFTNAQRQLLKFIIIHITATISWPPPLIS